MKTTLNTLINIIQVPRGRFLINKCESTLITLIPCIYGSFTQGCFPINKCESNLDALINMNQVPRGRFLINKCENNSKYIDKYYSSPKRSFSNQQV